MRIIPAAEARQLMPAKHYPDLLAYTAEKIHRAATEGFASVDVNLSIIEADAHSNRLITELQDLGYAVAKVSTLQTTHLVWNRSSSTIRVSWEV